jgi:acyl carrier protein
MSIYERVVKIIVDLLSVEPEKVTMDAPLPRGPGGRFPGPGGTGHGV